MGKNIFQKDGDIRLLWATIVRVQEGLPTNGHVKDANNWFISALVYSGWVDQLSFS